MKSKNVLTNPPFGDNRRYQAKTKQEHEIAELYELWHLAKINSQITGTIDKMIKGKPIDLNVDFLIPELLPNEP